MRSQAIFAALLRRFYQQFYNRFAFTYDVVSRIVSRGDWREWTRAAIPFVRGPHVLEIAIGTGNLLLDLADAGCAPVGVDLSPYMIEITRKKLEKSRRARLDVRHRAGEPDRRILILRAAVQELPFATSHFNSVVMTFPPGFITDPRAMQEMRRVLAEEGNLIWVDAPHLYPHDMWSRFLNWAYGLSGGGQEPSRGIAPGANDSLNQTDTWGRHVQDWLPRAGWSWEVRRVEHRAGYVHVIIGSKVNLADHLSPDIQGH